MKSRISIILSLIASYCMSQNTNWENYGNSKGGERYVNLNQIDAYNVEQLRSAWTFQTGEIETYKEEEYLLERAAFEATPIVIEGIMYFPTPSNRVYALNARTGEEIWEFDPKVDLFHSEFSELTCRGVSYWSEGREQRIFVATVDGRVISIDAKTGQKDDRFGDHGEIDLKLGVGLIQVTSAPAIIDDIIIVGSSIGDNNRTHDARGVVRAFNVRSGEELWSFDPIPTSSSDLAFSAWEKESALRTGAANVWATISVDAENEIVFLPSSSPSPDFYGGERLGNNDYANSVIALNARSGKYLWHFQVVHHDVWDYDIAAQPVLFDFKKEGREFPAIAIGTKMGHIFVLNRLNGEALMPYEEKSVPKSNVPGEHLSPTQPIPLLPKPLSLQNLTTDDIWGPSEDALDQSLKEFNAHRYEGIFTPPSFEGTLVAPGNTGGIHWGGMSIDRKRNILITNINNFGHIIQLHPRHDGIKYEAFLDSVRNDNNYINPETNRMFGTPYRMSRQVNITIDSLGIWGMTKPPWGTIVAIDLNSGEKLWEKPLGYMSEEPSYKEYGSINLGGTFVTSSGLTFVAATVDNQFRCFETKTGKLLWKSELPASGIATPMSYEVNGKQYIAIAAGGHGKNSLTKLGDYLVVYSLPEKGK